MVEAHTYPGSPSLRRYVYIMFAVYAVWIALYYLTGWIGSVRGPAFDPYLPIDDAIPYVPSLLPVYFLAYIIIPGIFLISRQPDFINRAYVTIIAANAFAFIFFMAFPSMGPERIAADPDGSVAQWMAGLIHGVDSRYNAMPSLHATNPWLLFLLAARRRGWSAVTALFFLLAMAIGAATVLVKQHYVLDLISGIALAAAAVWAVGKLRISGEAW